jgi:hypothetical protein
MTILEKTDLHGLIRGRPCLVLGRSIATAIPQSDVRRDIAQIIAERAKKTVSPDRLAEELDDIRANSQEAYDDSREAITTYLRALTPSTAINVLARTRWAAVVSLTEDECLDEAVRQHYDSQPTPWRTAFVSNAKTVIRRGQSLVTYRLLGSLREAQEDSRVALTVSELLLRRGMWAAILAPLRDTVRDGAYVFLGTEGSRQELREFLSVIFSGDAPYPSRLIFLKGDPCATDAVIIGLTRGRTDIFEVDADWREVLRIIQDVAPFQLRLVMPPGGQQLGLDAQIATFKHLVSTPPSGTPTFRLRDRRQEVLDSLFRPLSVEWSPFQFDLDLRRTQAAELVSTAAELGTNESRSISCILVRGEASVGKSTLCKRAALELRKAGHLVLWCRRQSTESVNSFRDLAKELKRRKSSGELRTSPIIFLDDPYALRVSMTDVFFPLEAEGVRAVVVVVARNTDYSIQSAGLRLPVVPDSEIEIRFELDDDEIGRLPDFLVTVGAAQDRKNAEQQWRAVSSAKARDILCSFWYLLPDTRSVLSGSLEDEYFRLGGGERLAQIWAENASQTSAIARRAYEYVAVTSGLDIGLPIEVLVRALRMSYESWLDLCSAGKPLWGLLYPDESADGETVVYFNRNEVVTRVLLRQLNGGLGHAGEFRVLRELIGACDTATPAYREFLIDVLVKRQRTLSERLTDREGRELFEVALTVFPSPDRVIAHHYGKWLTEVGQDPTAGYEQLQRALSTPEFALATQEERIEFIHTSMAAAVVKRVAKNLQDRDSGLDLIKRHLREASTPGFFNLHSVHIQAHALLSLQQGEDRTSLEAFIEASRSIERALQFAGNLASARRRGRHLRDIEIMEDLKRRLIESLEPFADLQERALKEF